MSTAIRVTGMPSSSFAVTNSCLSLIHIWELKAQVKKAARSINNDDLKSGGGNAGTGGGIPVSYTHLDVYKRQDMR